MVVKSLKCLYSSPVPCCVTGWYLTFDVVTLTDILVPDPDMYTPVFAMLYLTLNIWYQYLAFYTWPLISDTGTWHAITHLTCYHTLDMLSPSTSKLDLILWHLTGYCFTWHLYYIAYSWLSPLRRLGMIIILLPDSWYSWTFVLLNSCIPEPPVTGRLLILYSWYCTPVGPVIG